MTESTKPWLQFLAQNGARIDQDPSQQIAAFGEASPAAQLPRNFIAPLTDLGAIEASGEDAVGFLHNQLTNDVEQLAADQARLAGYCTPKGRLLATFTIWRTADAILLLLPRQIQAQIQKRLQMYVLRSKVKLNDAGERLAVLGLAGEAIADSLKSWFPTLPAQAHAKVDSEAGTLIRVADAAQMPRYLWVAPPAALIRAWPELVKQATPVATALWRLTEIHAGMPQVTQATQEQFVPQMVNYELIGGVNFKKGCYPGQEIVARSQYLGKLKRRMLLATVDSGEVRAGTEVYASGDPEQPCGMVVNAEPNLQNGADCLVELKIAAAEEGSVHLGSAGGPALRFIPLPYPLPA
jgi:folate-binding protein YgfZ